VANNFGLSWKDSGGAFDATHSGQVLFASDNNLYFDSANSGGGFFFRSAGGATSFALTAAVLRPGDDNVKNLGAAGNRWATVYAGTGAINTSDATEKTPLQPVPEAVKCAVRRVIAGIGVFQWRDAVAAKGDAARLHVGVTAQAVAEAFAAEGVDAQRWALFCADELPGGQTRLGVRYEQLLALGLACLG
jgi:hypothetical protein